MSTGFHGQIASVDLTTGSIIREPLDPSAYAQFLGGYGLGVRLLLERMSPASDPLGPDNLLGFFPGLLTGSGAPLTGRFMVVGKSPLTGGWGESNCGGHVGPALRSCGLDGILVAGESPQPAYLVVTDERTELHDACDLWGADTLDTERSLKEVLGKDFQVLSIGPAGENRSLISAMITDGGRAAARSGLAAVMGAKRLKAIAVQGSRRLPVHDRSRLTHLSRAYAAIFRGPAGPTARVMSRMGRLLVPVLARLRLKFAGGPSSAIVHIYREYGTCFGMAFSSAMGDAPVRNWGGIAGADFPLSRSFRISDRAVVAHKIESYGCSNCPVRCGGIVELPQREGAPGRAHKPEYETLAAFGSLLLNDDLDTILHLNALCDRLGMDTISTGATVAFALECAERGLLREVSPHAADLKWGDGEAILALVEQMARREGAGELFSDGVQRAAARIGASSESLAIHVGGQELPMHDPRYAPILGVAYVADATPGRHNPANAGVTDVPALRAVQRSLGLDPSGGGKPYGYGRQFALLNRYMEVSDCSGLCSFALLMGRPPVREWINATTGWQLDDADLMKIGHRIQIARHLFNQRAAMSTNDRVLPRRPRGDPPAQRGPLRGIMLDVAADLREYRETLELDVDSGYPSLALLESLGLAALAGRGEEVIP